jgi:hypothetical protein
MLEKVTKCCNLKRMKMAAVLAKMLLSTEYFSFLSWCTENLSKSIYRSGFMGSKFQTFSTIICNYLAVNIQITLVLYFNNIILFIKK